MKPVNFFKDLNRYKPLIAIIFLSYSIAGVCASMFQKNEEEVVLFSPMKGHITLNGQPLAEAKIKRFLKWKDQKGETEGFSTDKNGAFSLPVKKDTLRLNAMSHFVVEQELSVVVAGEVYFIWTMGKDSKLEYGELGGKPVNLRCELSDDDIPMRLDNALLMTKCKWDTITKIKG